MVDDGEADRELGELTSELRVLLAAATVQFAFLLTLPFTTRFGQIGTRDQVVYFIAFMATAFAIVLFLGETPYHRLRRKPYDKERLITTASRQAIAGIGCLAIALPAVVYVVTSVLLPSLALAAATSVLVAAVITWFALPLARRNP